MLLLRPIDRCGKTGPVKPDVQRSRLSKESRGEAGSPGGGGVLLGSAASGTAHVIASWEQWPLKLRSPVGAVRQERAPLILCAAALAQALQHTARS
jgi:hypothetical protein